MLMARYFFHIQTDSRWTDEAGVELASPLEARAQAIETCGQMVRDEPDKFWGSRPWTIVVTDAAGLILWELSMDGQSSAAGAALR
jgi:hypothetical protein